MPDDDLTVTIDTSAGAVQSQTDVVLVVAHGSTERTLTGTVRAFLDEFGVERYEIIGGEQTIGFLPEQVHAITEG